MSISDSVYLQRTLDLAAQERGTIRKGPLLGWVVVKNDLVIAEGTSDDVFALPQDHHRLAVWSHSELFLSINPFANSNRLASFCTDVGIQSFRIATEADSPIRAKALDLNRRYLTWSREKRPYIILKWAETRDGFMARANHRPYWISNSRSRQLVHQWRSQEETIWVGKDTYCYDNPRLNVRHWQGLDPVRIVVDRNLQLDRQLQVFDQSQPTWCYNAIKSETHRNLLFIQLSGLSSWSEWISVIFNDLYQRGVQSVFVEGGETLLSFLLSNEWWDEARVFRAPALFKDGLKAPKIHSAYLDSWQMIDDNALSFYRRSSTS